MLKERNQRGGNRNQLLRADVHVIHFLFADEHKVAGFAGIYQFANDAPLIVKFDVGLRDHVAVFFPCREIEGEGFEFCRTLAVVLQLAVDLLSFVLLQMVSGFLVAVAGVHHADVVKHAAVFHAPIRRLDEAVVIDPRIAAQ